MTHRSIKEMLEIHDSISQKGKILKFISNGIIMKKEMEF